MGLGKMRNAYEMSSFFFEAENGIRDLVGSRGFEEVYKEQIFQ